jgi:hypothetical protein
MLNRVLLGNSSACLFIGYPHFEKALRFQRGSNGQAIGPDFIHLPSTAHGAGGGGGGAGAPGGTGGWAGRVGAQLATSAMHKIAMIIFFIIHDFYMVPVRLATHIFEKSCH